MSLDTAIIQQYYAGILRLTPSAATINAYAQLPSYEAALDAMENAAVSSVNPITKLYQAAFDRVPDSAGLTNYTAAYGAGAGTMTLKQIATQWTSTIEFTTDYPASMPNADYVGLLYWNVLHRSADPVGAANFTAALNAGTMTRADVLLELSQSPEFALRIDGHIRGFQEQCALNDPAAYTGTLWDKVPPGPGETFTLTTNIDNFVATTDNAVFNGVADANGNAPTMNTGDILQGAGGLATFNITGVGVSTALVQTTDVDVVSVRAVNDTTVKQDLMAGVASFASNGSIADLNVTAGDLATVYGLNNTVNTASGNANLTVTYASTAGKADVAKFAINNVGTKVGTAAAIVQTVNANNTGIEAIELATAGVNYATLTTGGTDTKTITITGNGTNTLTIDSAAVSEALKLDAGLTTGTNVLTFNGVSSADEIIGGKGADTLVSNLTVAGQVVPVISGVETLKLDFDAAAVLNASKITGVTTVGIAGSGAAASITNLAATATTLNTTDNNGTVSVSYATGAKANVDYNVGGDAAVTNTSTTVANVADLTINAIGKSTSGLGNLAAGSALTALTLTTAAAANDLTVGAVTAANLQTLAVNSAGGDVSVSAAANGTFTKLTSIDVQGTGAFNLFGAHGAALKNIDTATAGGTSVFDSLNVELGDKSSIHLGNILAGDSDPLKDGAVISAINVVLGSAIAESEIGTIGAASIGDVNVTVGANEAAAGVDVVFGDLLSDSIGNITVSVGANNTVTMSTDDTTTSATVGNVTVSGAGNFVFDFASTAGTGTIGVVDASQLTAGTADIDLAGADDGTILTGGAKNDTLAGGAGDDIITGNLGADQLTGNGGADTFTYTAWAQTGITVVTADEITDFTTAVDLIDVTTAAGTNANYDEARAAYANFAAIKAAADGILDATHIYAFVADSTAGGDGYLFYGADGSATNVIVLTGKQALADFNFTDII